jgi:hypothetical protein
MALLHIVWVIERISTALFRPELNLRAQLFSNLPQALNLPQVSNLREVIPTNLYTQGAPTPPSYAS